MGACGILAKTMKATNFERRRSIAVVVDSLSGGGAERAVLTLTRALREMGHIGHAIPLMDKVHYDISREEGVHPVDTRGFKVAGVYRFQLMARRLESVMRRIEERDGVPIDVVVAQLPLSYRVVSICGFPNSYFCIQVSFERTLQQALRRGLRRYLIERSRWRVLDGKNLIAVSRGVEGELEASRLFRPSSTRTIYNPHDLSRIRRLAAEEIAGIPSEPYVLHVGRAARQKRLDVLFEAFRRVDEPTKLAMLSSRPQRVARMAGRYGLSNRVIVKPFQQNPFAWMASAQLLVISSDFEGFSLAAVEALACGTPVVSTDCPHGQNEILTGDLARWLVPVGDAAALGEKMAEALATDINVSDPAVLSLVDARTIARQYLDLARN
jgi:glycosyltransferase involved in cell wall biosynthesis